MGRKKEQKLNKKRESPEDKRKRLVAELRLFGHVESAKLLEADGRAGELTVVYAAYSPNARGHAELQEFGSGEWAEKHARTVADMYSGLEMQEQRNIHADPDAVGVWALKSDWMPMVGYEDKWNEEAEPEHEDRHNN